MLLTNVRLVIPAVTPPGRDGAQNSFKLSYYIKAVILSVCL